MPRERSPCPEQEGGEGTTVGNWQRSAAWTLPPVQEKTLQKNLQTCNAHLGVLKPVSCLWGPTHCFLGRGLSLLRVSFPRPRLPRGLFCSGGEESCVLSSWWKTPSPPRRVMQVHVPGDPHGDVSRGTGASGHPTLCSSRLGQGPTSASARREWL